MSYPHSETGTPHVYVSKKKKAADLTSTAYSFTLVSIAGILFLVLFFTGVLPFETPFPTKVLASVVMGIMFLAFLAIGIRSFMELKSLSAAAEQEEQTLAEITDWFRSTYPREALKETEEGEEESQLYFSRCERMQALILEQYDNLEENFLDHIIEMLYEEYYQKNG